MSTTGRVCLIYNPVAGRGKTLRELNRVRPQFPDITYHATTGPGHGEQLAYEASEAGYDTVIAAGGDGTVHEVANGLLRAPRTDVVFSTWPIGSANDYAYSLGLTQWWHPRNRATVCHTKAVDVGRITDGNGKQRHFVNCLGMGFNAAITVEARRIRFLRGMPLYALGLIRALQRQFLAPSIAVEFDGVTREVGTLGLSLLIAQREGGFPLMPLASLEDGLFDCMHVGPLTRWEVIRFLPRMATGKLPHDYPNLWLQKAATIRIRASQGVRIHLDGEFFCHPEDDVREFTIETLPKRLRVMTYPTPPSC